MSNHYRTIDSLKKKKRKNTEPEDVYQMKRKQELIVNKQARRT
jgi:hypothetical protein